MLGFGAEAVDESAGGVVVIGRTAAGSRRIGPVDRIIVATGQRPDLALTRELRLDLDPWLESARSLGPMIDPNLHSCGSVPPHGYRELSHPEPGYFTVGIKSYGRAPTFLMATGYEQVRSVAAHLAGDDAAAVRCAAGAARNRRLLDEPRAEGGVLLRRAGEKADAPAPAIAKVATTSCCGGGGA